MEGAISLTFRSDEDARFISSYYGHCPKFGAGRGHKIEIDIEENIIKDLFSITIRDNGCGMDAETLDRVTDPFFTSRTVRKVGLGIPLLKQNAEQTGGSLTISSREGEGTTIQAIFSHSHLDRPPVGNIANTVVLLVASNPDIRFVYRHVTEKGKYLFDSKEVKDFLKAFPLTTRRSYSLYNK